MHTALFILGVAMLIAIQPHAVAAQTTGPGDRALVNIANDSPRNHNCPRNDSGECMTPLLPETGGDFSSLLFDRSEEVANRTTHGATIASATAYYDDTGTTFIIILVGSSLGVCILAALMFRQHAHTSGRAHRRVRRNSHRD